MVDKNKSTRLWHQNYAVYATSPDTIHFTRTMWTRSLWELPSSGLLRCEQWWFIIDISGKFIGPISKGQEFLALENGVTDW